MLKFVKNYVIVADHSFLIKNESNLSEKRLEFLSYIPNVPFYHHLFDKNDDIMNLTNYIISMKMKDVLVIMPDDTLDIFADQKILEDYFYTCKAKKVEIDYQGLLLSENSESYISVSKTERNMVMQYIKNKKSLAQKYYDKEFVNLEQMKADMGRMHIDCEAGNKAVYINNVNGNMDIFQSFGYLVSASDIFRNARNRIKIAK